MVWYKPWTWYRGRRIESLNPQNKQQSGLEREISRHGGASPCPAAGFSSCGSGHHQGYRPSTPEETYYDGRSSGQDEGGSQPYDGPHAPGQDW